MVQAAPLEVEFRGASAIQRKLRRIPPVMTQLVEDAAKFGRDRMRVHAKPHPADKGTLSNAVTYSLAAGARPLSASVGLLGRGHGMSSSLAALAATVNYGRRPGRPPSIKAIYRWLRSHGYQASATARNVAAEIGVRGTKGVFFLEKAERDLNDQLPKILQDIERQVEQEWAA